MILQRIIMELYSIFIWVGFALLFLLGELSMPGTFFLLSFAVGSLSAGLIAALDGELVGQLVGFLAVSAVGLVGTFLYFRKKSNHKRDQTYLLTIDAFVGKKALVISLLPLQPAGYVVIEGQTWLARWQTKMNIEVGMQVEIMALSGCHLVVQPIRQSTENS